jgi:hypothetical protein
VITGSALFVIFILLELVRLVFSAMSLKMIQFIKLRLKGSALIKITFLFQFCILFGSPFLEPEEVILDAAEHRQFIRLTTLKIVCQVMGATLFIVLGSAMRYGVNTSIFAVEKLDEYKFQRALYYSSIVLGVYLFSIVVVQATFKQVYQVNFIEQSKQFLNEFSWYL